MLLSFHLLVFLQVAGSILSFINDVIETLRYIFVVQYKNDFINMFYK